MNLESADFFCIELGSENDDDCFVCLKFGEILLRLQCIIVETLLARSLCSIK